jgi:hypothetical protein
VPNRLSHETAVVRNSPKNLPICCVLFFLKMLLIRLTIPACCTPLPVFPSLYQMSPVLFPYWFVLKCSFSYSLVLHLFEAPSSNSSGKSRFLLLCFALSIFPYIHISLTGLILCNPVTVSICAAPRRCLSRLSSTNVLLPYLKDVFTITLSIHIFFLPISLPHILMDFIYEVDIFKLYFLAILFHPCAAISSAWSPA